MKNILTIIGLAAASLAGVQAQVLLTSVNTAFTENFNSFSSTANVSWTDNSTLTGWYMNSSSTSTNLTISTGSSTTGTVYNYGATNSTDRAMGYLGSGGNAHTNFFVRLKNTSGVTITSLNVSYDGELWRSGGTQTADSNNRLVFSYATGSPTLPTNASQTGWTAVAGLNYAPTVSVAAGAQSGAATSLSASISGLSLANNSEIYLRWYGNDGTGTDAGLAIDNFSVTAVPEPKTWVMIGIGTSFMLWNLRRRRRIQD